MAIQESRSQKKIENLVLVFLVLMGFITAAYFRFFNLRQSPGWYSDEGNPIDLAENWMKGNWENYGVDGAPFSQRPPLFMYTVSTAMRLFGVDIVTSRGVCAVSSLICLLLVSGIAWKSMGKKEGLATLWITGIAPWVVMFGRFGLTYNLMAPFFLLSLLSAYFYARKRSSGWLIASAVCSALAFSTDYLGIICGITAGLLILIKHPKDLGWFILIFAGTVGLVLIPVLQKNPEVFFADNLSIFTNRSSVQSSPFSIVSIIINYSELLRRESWILIGLCGLFLIPDSLLRNILLTAVGLTLVLVTRAYTPVGGGLHYLMHLFPIFSLGMAVFILNAYQWVKRCGNEVFHSVPEKYHKLTEISTVFLALAVTFSPVIWMFLGTFSMVGYNSDFLFTGNDDLLLVNAKDADLVQHYIAANARIDDQIIGSPALLWGFPSMNRSDFLTALAYNGHQAKNYLPVEKQRFKNSISLENARFVILDPLAEEFAPKVLPGMQPWLDEIHSWPVVYEAGKIRVYEKQ